MSLNTHELMVPPLVVFVPGVSPQKYTLTLRSTCGGKGDMALLFWGHTKHSHCKSAVGTYSLSGTMAVGFLMLHVTVDGVW